MIRLFISCTAKQIHEGISKNCIQLDLTCVIVSNRIVAVTWCQLRINSSFYEMLTRAGVVTLMVSAPVLVKFIRETARRVLLLTERQSCAIGTRKPSWRKGNARQQCMYEGPLRTNVKSVETSILVLKVIQGHCFRCQSKPVYDFLLVINCNLGPISHRFRDMASYWFKIAKFSYPPLI